jgi:hypothetical protein
MTQPEFFKNEQAEMALGYVQFTDTNLFLTGKAGTGKTTFLKKLKESSLKRMIVVAPTGVAAINAGGVTIHSFFSLPFVPFIPKEARFDNQSATSQQRLSKVKIGIIRNLDLLVIDEISMVRADILDAIDEVLRRYKDRTKPFGGVQLLMIGDLQQLPPVVPDADAEVLGKYYDTFFFYGSRALQRTRFVTVELQHIYRQTDRRFIDLLNAVRENRLTGDLKELLIQRTIPGYNSDDHIVLTTHNSQSQRINDNRLKELRSPSYFFKAKVTGEFPESAYPTDFELELKEGARVMFLKNDPSPEKLFFNGKIGVLTSVDKETVSVRCEGDTSDITVKPMAWENMQYSVDEKTQEIVENVIGTFEQFPLKLAWAITIHKSQGLTFDRVVIDAQAAFAHGQIYVALSRCRTLEGLVLSTPVRSSGIISNADILRFEQEQREAAPTRDSLLNARAGYLHGMVRELFDFDDIQKRLNDLRNRLQESEQVVSGNIHAVAKEVQDSLVTEIEEINSKFGVQLQNLLVAEPEMPVDGILQERVAKASQFFGEKLNDLIRKRVEMINFETDNKTVGKGIQDSLTRFSEAVVLKSECLAACSDGFDIKHYLAAKSKTLPVDRKIAAVEQERKDVVLHPHADLARRLKAWRAAKAVEIDAEPYDVLRQKSIDHILELMPTDNRRLKTVKGLGAKRIREFGPELLEIITEYAAEAGLIIGGVGSSPQKNETTFGVTLRMFRSGMTPADIARERGVSLQTIVRHLCRHIAGGEIDVSTLVDLEKYKRCRDYFLSAGTRSLKTAFEAMNGEVDYATINYVLSSLTDSDSQTAGNVDE